VTRSSIAARCWHPSSGCGCSSAQIRGSSLRSTPGYWLAPLFGVRLRVAHCAIPA